jgi:hypothetical protein
MTRSNPQVTRDVLDEMLWDDRINPDNVKVTDSGEGSRCAEPSGRTQRKQEAERSASARARRGQRGRPARDQRMSRAVKLRMQSSPTGVAGRHRCRSSSTAGSQRSFRNHCAGDNQRWCTLEEPAIDRSPEAEDHIH